MRNKKTLLLLTFIMIMALLSSGCLFNIGPVIEVISNQTGKVNQEFTYQVIAYDPDNGELTYSLAGEPEGMQIGSIDGLITWNPGEDQIGIFTVEIEVSNGNNFSVKQFTITIQEAFLTSITVLLSAISMYIGNSKKIISIIAYYSNEDSTELALTDGDYSSSNTALLPQ